MNETVVGPVITGWKMGRGYFYKINLMDKMGKIKDIRQEHGFLTESLARRCGCERRLGLAKMCRSTEAA